MPPSFSQLCRAFTLASETLPPEMPLRRRMLAQLAWWSVRDRRDPLPPHLERGLELLWRDACVRELEPGQKLLLHWIAAAVAGAWSRAPEWAREVVDLSMETALTVWRPSARATGPTRPRTPIVLLSELEPSPDPSGDPEPPVEAFTLEPRRGKLDWAWSSVGSVLDGLAVWPAAVQRHLGLPLGDMRRTGQPAWNRLTDSYREVREAANTLEAMQNVA